MLFLNEQIDHSPLFHAVGCVCRFREEILLLERAGDKSYPNCWGIPTGKVEENEELIQAMVRELFEETGILLSSENLHLFKTYHVVSEEMSFLYTVFRASFSSKPRVKIRAEEHKDFGWYALREALTLKLVPNLEGCLRDKLTPIVKTTEWEF